MKQCPKCEQMNSSYAGICDVCGVDISKVKDMEPDSEAIESNPVDDPIPAATGPDLSESFEKIDCADLNDIYSQLEDIKAQLSKGSKLCDVNMPFGRMVVVFIKIILATIPAMLIVGFLLSIFWAVTGGLLFRLFFKGYW